MQLQLKQVKTKTIKHGVEHVVIMEKLDGHISGKKQEVTVPFPHILQIQN